MVMKIPVIFINGSLGVICGEDLDEMLEKKLIVAFQRTSELAIVGRDELRSNRGDGNGSWRNRKKNQRPREEVIPIPNQSGIVVGSSSAPQRTICTPSSPRSSPP
jgi:hypothetical protein